MLPLDRRDRWWHSVLTAHIEDDHVGGVRRGSLSRGTNGVDAGDAKHLLNLSIL
jgi:hypothetical protein